MRKTEMDRALFGGTPRILGPYLGYAWITLPPSAVPGVLPAAGPVWPPSGRPLPCRPGCLAPQALLPSAASGAGAPRVADGQALPRRPHLASRCLAARRARSFSDSGGRRARLYRPGQGQGAPPKTSPPAISVQKLRNISRRGPTRRRWTAGSVRAATRRTSDARFRGMEF